MWHEALRWLADQAPQAPSTDSDHDVLLAVIGAAAPLVVAVTALLATLHGRRRDPAPTPAPAPIPLNTNDADDEEDVLRARNRVLETWLWRNRYDPNRITTGNEAADDVRIA